MTEGIVTIQPGREKSIRNQHPWIFSGAIARAHQAIPGETVTVLDHQGAFLGRGYWNPRSQIQVRLLTWQDEPIDDAWWERALRRALDARRQRLAEGDQAAFRWVNAENDFLPGLIVDVYAGWLVLQALTLYMDTHKQRIATLMAKMLPAQGVYERSDVDVRGKEGLKPASGVLWGAEPPALIKTSGLLADVRSGHKTGLYLDQTQNHRLLQRIIATAEQPMHVLNCFSYTGAFGAAALAGGAAEVTNVDSSREALQLAEQNCPAPAGRPDAARFVQADCFDYLRQRVQDGEQSDMVILDPPKFAHTKQQIDKAARGYKDLNLSAFRLIRSGGYLMTFSCSGAISPDLFQKIVFGALADSGRQAQIIQHLGAADDHPIALTFPEGEYLKGLLLRVY